MKKSRAEGQLRILHFILALTPTNGQYNEHCLPLRHFRDITICTYFHTDTTPPPELTLYDGNGTLLGFYRAARAALTDKKYDLIHVHTPHAGVLLLMTLVLSGLFRKLKPSTVHTVQNSYQSFKLRHKLLFVPSFAYSQRLVFCSYASYKSFPSLFKWLGGTRINVVQNCVDLARIDHILAGRELTPDGMFRIVTVGLIKIKDPFTVLDAFQQCHKQTDRLVFIGKGTLQQSLSEEFARLGLQDQVMTTGMIERDEVFRHFGKSDLFVSASWGEGLPVAVLEAMACRCPVILSDIPPHREIANGTDFIPLVSPGDSVGFARKIEKFKRMTPAERNAVGQKCRDLIESEFSLPAMHAKYARVYGPITGKPLLAELKQIQRLN